jgi:hypothetical protein
VVPRLHEKAHGRDRRGHSVILRLTGHEISCLVKHEHVTVYLIVGPLLTPRSYVSSFPDPETSFRRGFSS